MFSRLGSVASYILFDLVGSVARFPVWWYGEGLHGVIQWAVDGLVYRYRSYALGLWLKNFLVPMYGEYDFTGRVVSVFMRFVTIVGRSLALVVEALALVVVIFIYLAAPVAFIIMLILNLYHGALPTRVAGL